MEKKPYLAWYVKDKSKISEDSAVEHILNNGNWRDVQEMIKILGMAKAARIFRKRSKPDRFGRQNYRPEIRHYFNLYFDKYAPRDTDQRTE